MKRSYPHMCRNGHEEIGHNNSEIETRPLCEALDQLQQSAERERVLREALESCNNRNLEACPSCGYGTGDPHAKDCKLAAALAQSASKETDNV